MRCRTHLWLSMLLELAAAWVGAIGAGNAAEHVPAYALIERIAGPDGGGWDYTTVDVATRRLYVARDAGILAMDLETRQITPVAIPGERDHIAVPLTDRGLIVSTNGGRNTATVFDTRLRKVLASISVGRSPDAAVYDPATQWVAVMNHRGGTISLIDPTKAAVVKTIDVGGILEFAAVSGDGLLFVNVESQNEIAVIDLVAGRVLRRMALAGCEGPSGLAYDGEDGLVASVCGNGITKILHAADGSEVASIQTGLGSDGLIFDAARKLLFVPAGKDGTLTLIALGKGREPCRQQRLKTAPGARLGALDAKTGRLYLPTAEAGPLPPGQRRPSIVPGTFALLVVGTP
jgi:DNA-binding beta-propeller fold protein YncE